MTKKTDNAKPKMPSLKTRNKAKQLFSEIIAKRNEIDHKVSTVFALRCDINTLNLEVESLLKQHGEILDQIQKAEASGI